MRQEEMKKEIERKIYGKRVTGVAILPDGTMAFKFCGKGEFFSLRVKEQPDRFVIEIRKEFFSTWSLKYEEDRLVPIYFHFDPRELDDLLDFVEEKLRGRTVDSPCGILFSFDRTSGSFFFELNATDFSREKGQCFRLSLDYDPLEEKAFLRAYEYDIISSRDDEIDGAEDILAVKEISTRVEEER